MKRIDVSLGERSYPIFIGTDLLAKTESFSATKNRKVVVISNDKVAPLYASTVIQSIKKAGGQPELFTLPDGEEYKTLESFNEIHSFLLQNYYGRDVLLIALGGGVIGDLVGFVAATYQRGVDFIQIPTTLLAQVDSSVGGKTAVNHPLGKNMIGAFYQPKEVLIDINVLNSLSEREFNAGMAEVIKYGIISDADFFTWIEENVVLIQKKSVNELIFLISRCCEIKAQVVSEDEKESGKRVILNLGHTFGHAIETQMGYGHWLHGEAVAVGIVMASVMALQIAMLSIDEVNRIKLLLKKVYLPVKAPENMSYACFIKHLKRDKKVLDDQLRFILPIRIGSVKVIADIKKETLEKVIKKH